MPILNVPGTGMLTKVLLGKPMPNRFFGLPKADLTLSGCDMSALVVKIKNFID